MECDVIAGSEADVAMGTGVSNLIVNVSQVDLVMIFLRKPKIYARKIGLK